MSDQPPDAGSVQEAGITIAIAEDGMTAVVESCVLDADLTAEILHAAMRKAGVAEPEGPLADRVLMKAKLGKDVKGMLVAQGEPAVPPQDASLDFKGDIALPVFHGDAIAVRIPPRPGAPGRSVNGQTVPAPDRSPADILLEEDCGAELDEETGEVRAQHYGLADFRQNKLTVKALISVDPSKLRVSGTLYANNFLSEAVTVDTIKRELWAMGVRTVSGKSLARALEEAARTGEPQTDVTLAKGTPPIHGEDGRFELAFVGAQEALSADQSDVVDPRERSKFEPIREGTLIGKLLPPKEGHFGRDVYGEDLVPRKGRPAVVHAGENVSVSADGVEFTAGISGMITWDGNRVSVLEMVHVSGDVSFSTGNLRLETGSVMIDGSVRDGFKVATPGDVCVGTAIESAEITAGGNVGVKGGIVMGGEGKVRAKGDVSCNFAENAVIEAGADVIVAHNLSTSLVTAKGKVVCVKGKGIIMGGHVEAAKGVEANEIGSEFGVKTMIRLDAGLEGGSLDSLVAERKTLRDHKSQIDAAIGTEPPRVLLAKIPVAKRAQVAEVIKKRIGIVNRMKEIEVLLEERRRALAEVSELRVKVRRMAHPGTVIVIADKKLALHEPVDGPCSFHYDPDTGAIVME